MMNFKGKRKQLYVISFLVTLMIAYTPTVFNHAFSMVMPVSSWVEYDKIYIETPQEKGGSRVLATSYSIVHRSVQIRYDDVLKCDYGNGWVNVSAQSFAAFVDKKDNRKNGEKWEFRKPLPWIQAKCKIESHISVYPKYCFGCEKVLSLKSNVFKIK